MKSQKKQIITTAILTMLAIAFTVTVENIDVQSIGPRNSCVGFAALNQAVFDWTGVHMFWYTLTDWLGLTGLFTGLGFAVLGLVQWIKRKSIRKVDAQIILLGVFYLIVIGIYFYFETHIVNYRPVLMNGYLEASYPSSHTMIVVCIMGSAMMMFSYLLKDRKKHIADAVCVSVTVVTVLGRLYSGVHWFTDIIGGLLISAALLMAFSTACRICGKRTRFGGQL